MNKSDRVARAMVDQGNLLLGGFEILRRMVMSPDAPQIQVEEMRMAFMAGAQHLWGALFQLLNPDQSSEEPTPEELNRLEMIQKELEQWEDTIRRRIEPANGEG